MGFFKKIGNKLADGLLKSMVKSSGAESLNPYVGMLLKADPNDLIADEKFRLPPGRRVSFMTILIPDTVYLTLPFYDNINP